MLLKYSRLTGHTPFTADNESKLKEQIRKAEINTSLPSYLKLTAEGFIFISLTIERKYK